MGFDLFGRTPTADNGRYFRSNVWWWRPMHALIYLTCIDLLSDKEMRELGFNDGFSYSAQQALAIANRLGEVVADDEQLAERKKTVMAVVGHEAYQECWSKENILEFVEFLKHSGGFEVF